MAKNVQVQLADGRLVMCRVLERSYNPDVGGRTIWAQFEGREFMAVSRLGAWQQWTRQERIQPLVDDLERKARERRFS